MYHCAFMNIWISSVLGKMYQRTNGVWLKCIISVLFFICNNIISDNCDIYHMRDMDDEHIGT